MLEEVKKHSFIIYSGDKVMKKAFIICLFALIAVSGQLWAKEKTTLAVLPFSVPSAENIDYLQDGV